MSDYIKFDHYEAEPSIEDGFEYTSAIRVQCYSSFEYCLKRKIPMYPRRSFSLSKGSKEEFQERPSPNEESRHHQGTKKKKRTLWKTKVDDSGANTADETDQDILDIIDCAQQKRVDIDEGWCAAVADEGVDFSDEDCESVTSSISSGPSALHSSTAKKQRSLAGFVLSLLESLPEG
ncbi:hypothetical protein fugu_014296 [Takifugu bimaculatus]|uniref:Uncharacterized protein n=1 Tax=Takifugu bimaculatus TaxID=433685 RepID=A0A4Z2C2X5_9TELE|nr:hypothetical protein fugu_014296 [Takifugu bimaculatus]